MKPILPDIHPALVELASGTLPEDEQRELGALLASSPELRRELAHVQEILVARAEALQPLRPSDRFRERLLGTLAGPSRFAAFTPELKKIFDLDAAAVEEQLRRIDDPDAWDWGPPDVKLIHFSPGPAAFAGHSGFVRVAAGRSFPMHKHLGDEVSFVLEGVLWDTGARYLPGDRVESKDGSVHDYAAGPERDLILAVCYGQIEPVV